MSETSDYIRKAFTEGDDIRDAGLTTPEDIMRYDDILYGTDPKWQMLDVYRPKNAEGKKLPVIVSVHGGGWVYGDKERYQYYCMHLAQKGFAVVNFTYRLAPEFQYPANIEDTNLVFTWIMENKETYGFDTDHMFAVGDSAGGHNLSLYVAICTNPDYAQTYPFKVPEGLDLKAIALNCGVYYMEKQPEGEEPTLNSRLMEDYLPGKGTREELEQISVIHYITRNYPPVYLMTSVDDFAKDQAPVLQEKFLEHDVPFLFRLSGDKDNRLAHVFHLDIRSKDAILCNQEETDFFKSFL